MLVAGLVLVPAVPAESDTLSMAELDADQVRQLRQAGDIMPLETLLQQIRQDYPGRVIEIELEEEHDRYVYEMEIVDDAGLVWELYFDARTGELLERERED